DAQTVYGKTVCGLLRRAAAADVPALVFGGCVTEEAEALYDRGAAGIFSLCSGPMTLEDSMRRSASLLETRVRAAVSCFASGRASVDV
ncbi:MAG: glycerate kinase, partial [Clostridia bacterium]|nr:glycerate kinase [Clostridia bacterium]